MKECINKCKYWGGFYCTESCGIYYPVGTKLKDINYNKINAKGLSIFDGDKEIAYGFIGDVLKNIPHLVDREVKETRYYFDVFVITI